MGEDEEITIPDLLLDAAVQLVDHDMLALARACRIASGVLGNAPVAESWISDIIAVVTEAESVVAAAEHGAKYGSESGTTDLTPLRDKLHAMRGGLPGEDRLGASYSKVLSKLAQLELTAIGAEESEEGCAPISKIRKEITGLLDELGYPQR